MGNLMTSLWVGVSGLQTSQNAINTTSHNLANVNTTGYVRQQIVLKDFGYNTVGRSANYSQRVGLGVATEVVKQARNQFFDERYRVEYGRQGYYDAQYHTINELEDIYGELEGVSFQRPLDDMRDSLHEMAKGSNDPTKRATFVKKAEAFLERAQKIAAQTKSYQENLNTQICDKVDRINELGDTINELNQIINKYEAGGVERANDYRDLRNNALDELSNLISITYYEKPDGTVNVMAEGNSFINDTVVNKLGLVKETPYLRQVTDLSSQISDLNKKIKDMKNTPGGGNTSALEQQRDNVLKMLDKYIDFTVTYNNVDGTTSNTPTADSDGTINVKTSDGDELVRGALDRNQIRDYAYLVANGTALSIQEEITKSGNNIYKLNEQIKSILANDPTANVTALINDRNAQLAQISKYVPCTSVMNADGTMDVIATGHGKLVVGLPIPPETAGVDQTVATKIKDKILADTKTGIDQIQALNEQIKLDTHAGNSAAVLAAQNQIAAVLAGLSDYITTTTDINSDGTVNVKLPSGGAFIRGDVDADTAVDSTTAKTVTTTTNLLKPVWLKTGIDLFNFDRVPAADNSNNAGYVNSNDLGSLKGLLVARGSDTATYTDIPLRENYAAGVQGDAAYLNAVNDYNIQIESSAIRTSQAQFDQLIHGMVTAINNIFAPNKEITLADGTKINILDEENAPVGMDSAHTKGEALFNRVGVERYTTTTVTVFKLDADGNKIPVDPADPTQGFQTETITVRKYNEENTDDRTTLFTLDQLEINRNILKDYSKLPISSNKNTEEYDASVVDKLLKLYSTPFATLGPNNSTMTTFDNYYISFIGEMGNRGDTLKDISRAQEASVSQIGGQRSNIMGVSSDEELTNLIKFQHAYNASARYINVVSEMLEHIVTRL